MKGLILNDMYNTVRNMKQMLLIPIVWAFICLRDSDGAGGYIIICAFMFSMMTATVISYDEKSNWTKYAMILPVSKRAYILAKYVDTAIFSAAGCVIAAVFTVISNQIVGRQMGEVFWIYCIAGLLLGVAYGGLCIPFLVKYGAEKARYIMFAVIGIPGLIGYGFVRLMEEGLIRISTEMLERCLWFLPGVVLILVLTAMLCSIHIFEKKEF